MKTSGGLRERKKEKTRALIAETARRLFAQRGFEAVAVAEVADAAEVSEATVFNYFPTKEDLVFQGMEAFEQEMLQAVRGRAVGESAARAFGRFALTPRGLLAARDKEAAKTLLGVSRMIASSPALRAREEQILKRYTDSLAALLAEETGAKPGDLRPQVAAHAFLGLHASLIAYVRLRIVEENPDHARLARDMLSEGRKALQLLEGGLGGYAVKVR